jgi:hypothetical protein
MSFEFFKMTVTAIVRELTAEESSAIAKIRIEGDHVTVAYQSNPANEYTYTADPEFLTSLVQVVEATDLGGISLGGMVSDARRVGDLTETVQ